MGGVREDEAWEETERSDVGKQQSTGPYPGLKVVDGLPLSYCLLRRRRRRAWLMARAPRVALRV